MSNFQDAVFSDEQINVFIKNGIPAELNDHVDVRKRLARFRINEIRDQRIFAGIIFKEKRFQTDSEAQRNITGAVVSITALPESVQAGYVQQWIAMDNSIVEFSVAEFVQFGQVVGKHVATHKLQASTFKQRLENAESVEAAQAIVAEYLAAA